MDEKLKIALLQIAPTETIDGNLAKGIDACKKAKKLGADLVVFPELWSNGYEHPFSGYVSDLKEIPHDKIKVWQGKAITESSEFVMAFSRLAKQLQMAIAMTFFEKHNPQPLNTIIVFDRTGKKILKYSKVQTQDLKMEYFMDSGKSFDVAELDYGRGKVKIGSMICNDREHPEVARSLMLDGAEVIIIPNACRLYDYHNAQMKVRARENACVTLMVNYPIQIKAINGGSSNGRSCAYYPIFRDKDGEEIDMKIIEMGEDEEIAVANIDLVSLRSFRKKDYVMPVRKPKLYGRLCQV